MDDSNHVRNLRHKSGSAEKRSLIADRANGSRVPHMFMPSLDEQVHGSRTEAGHRLSGAAATPSRSLHPSGTGPEQETAQRVRVAQRLAALGEMTGGIAHDFGNILAVIESGLRLIERNLHSPEKQHAFIEATREGVERGRTLIRQLSSFAKQQEPGVHEGDINELVRGLERFLNYGAGPGIRVLLDLAPRLRKCRLDSSQFGNGLLNLVVNARDAMPSGGVIRIHTEETVIGRENADAIVPGAYIWLRVEDNGEGMPPHVAEKVLDTYFTTKGDKGTGLGLPQVRAFMVRIGGHIRIASQEGCGTKVDLFFPVEEAAPVTPP